MLAGRGVERDHLAVGRTDEHDPIVDGEATVGAPISIFKGSAGSGLGAGPANTSALLGS
jgi:hypothetical protein